MTRSGRLKHELRREGFVIIIALTAVGVAVWAYQLRNEAMLAAVVGASSVAYAGLTWRLLRSAQLDREGARPVNVAKRCR